jgi:hypothetical protein
VHFVIVKAYPEEMAPNLCYSCRRMEFVIYFKKIEKNITFDSPSKTVNLEPLQTLVKNFKFDNL